MKKGIKITSATYKVNIALPIDDRKVLSAAERTALRPVRRYKWMIVIDEDTGVRYQLQPNKTGGTISDAIGLWKWYIIDSSSVLSEDLYVNSNELNIPANTTFPVGTSLEYILREALTSTRNPIAPTIRISQKGDAIVEKGSNGILEISDTTFALNDSTEWLEPIPRVFSNIGGEVNLIPQDSFSLTPPNSLAYTNIADKTSIYIKRNYKGARKIPPMNNELLAGEATSNAISVTPLIPVLVGIGGSTSWLKENITEEFINRRLESTPSYTKLLMPPSNLIEVPDGRYNNSPDYFRWIAIPMAWNKTIKQYKANSFDFGEVGIDTRLFATILPVKLQDTNGLWDEQYMFYCTSYPTTFQYHSEELFKFILT